MRTTLSADLTRRAEAVADRTVALAVERALPYAFDSYQCAARLPRELAGADADTDVAAAFRDAVRERMRERLAAAWPERSVEGVLPDVVLEAIPDQDEMAFRVIPVRVAGRYRKLVRGLSQTVFHCRHCRGRRARRVCERCGGTGRLVAECVEELVRPAVQAALGGSRSAFHGSGREDVDVRMLGDGRPFVVTVQKPRVREFDADAVERAIAEGSGGRVTAHGLRIVDRATMRRITADHGEKEYRVVLEAETPLPADAAARLATLGDVELQQRTPQRVEARRADRVRARRVLALTVEDVAGRRATFTLRTDPGTYVKEFVSGDEGRTEPSCASVLGRACTCVELDVLGVGPA